MPNDLAAVVMAGGLGTRMKSATPKHLHPLLGRRMVDWVIGAARASGADRVVVVASPDTAALFDGVEVAVQQEPLGTGDAVRSARTALAGEQGDILVLNGDVPALTPELLRALVETHRSAGAAGTVLSFEPADLRSYGRIVRDAHGGLARIVEAGDASPEELALREVNSGIYVFRAERLWPRAGAARAAERPGRALRDRHARASSSATGSPSQCTLHLCRSRSKGSTRAWSSPPSRRPCATASTSGTCSPA